MVDMKESVAAVLVTYNRVDLLKRAIQSLLDQTVKIKYIVVINNNSTDGTKEYLESLDDEKIKFLHLAENLGGAGGFSAGLNFSSSLDVNYIWIMDDDAIATPHALEHLISAKDLLDGKSVDWGFICSHVLSDDDDCMNVPTISKKVNSTGYPSWPEYTASGIVGVDKATFVSVFLKKETVKAVGLPVKEMFIWGDDTEYTWRISNKYKCFYVANSIVYHKRVMAKSLSLEIEENRNRIRWYEYLYRNNFYSIRKHGNKKDLLIYLYFIFRTLFTVIFKSKKDKFRKSSIVFSGFFKGMFFNPKIDYPDIKND